jgi:hypothetical protein
MQAYLWLVADLRAAWRFTPAAWRRAWAILIPASLTWMVALSPVRAGPWTALAVAVTLMASAELYRIATPQAVSARGAAVGRLAIVWLRTLAFFAVLGSLLFVVFLSSAYAVASAGAGFDAAEVRTWAPAIDDRGREVLGAVAAVGVSLLSWAMTRIALAPAATAAAGRVLVLNAWPLTRGIGWALLAVRVAIAVPAVGVAALALRAPHVGGAATSSGAWMLGSVAGLVIGGVWLPLNTGLMAYIYHRRANP